MWSESSLSPFMFFLVPFDHCFQIIWSFLYLNMTCWHLPVPLSVPAAQHCSISPASPTVSVLVFFHWDVTNFAPIFKTQKRQFGQFPCRTSMPPLQYCHFSISQASPTASLLKQLSWRWHKYLRWLAVVVLQYCQGHARSTAPSLQLLRQHVPWRQHPSSSN